MLCLPFHHVVAVILVILLFGITGASHQPPVSPELPSSNNNNNNAHADPNYVLNVLFWLTLDPIQIVKEWIGFLKPMNLFIHGLNTSDDISLHERDIGIV